MSSALPVQPATEPQTANHITKTSGTGASTSLLDSHLTPYTTSSTIANTMAHHEIAPTTDPAYSTSDTISAPVEPRSQDLSSRLGLEMDPIRPAVDLMDLPNELLIPIINHTYPHHLENFARVNKRIFNLSQDALKEHWKLKKEHSVARVESLQPRKPHPFGQLADHVVKYYRSPLLAEYVDIVQIDCLDYKWPSAGKDAYPDYPLNSLVDMWRSLYGTMKRSTSNHAIRLLHKGSDEPVLALFLMCVPNIRYLKLQILFLDPISLLIDAINHIVAVKGPNALSKLHTLWLSLPRFFNNLDLFQCMLQIPSIRVAKFTGMTDGPPHGHCADFAPKSSNITALQLFDCDIGPRTLETILASMNQLKSFNIGWWSYSMSTKLDPLQILDCLKTRFEESLQSLALYGCHHSRGWTIKDYHHIDSFKAFSNLKDLCVNVELLIPKHDSPKMDFAVILPSSIETLLLYVNDADEKRCFKTSEAARQFVNCYRSLDRLPQLQNLEFRGLDALSVDWLREAGLESMMTQRGGTVDWERGLY